MKILTAMIFFVLAGLSAAICQTIAANGQAELPHHYRGHIDSLYQLTANAKEDSNLVKRLCLISFEYEGMGSDSAYLFAQKAIDLADKLKEPFFIIIALNRMANAYYAVKNYEKSTQFFQKALQIAVTNRLYGEELYVRVPLNNNYFLQGNYSAAMEISVEGLATAEKTSNKERMAHFTNVLGYIHMKLGNFEESQRYYSIYLQLAKQIKDDYLEGHALYNLADLAVAEKKFPEAIQYLNETLIIYGTRPLPSHDPRERKAYVYNKMADAYKLSGDYLAAKQYILLALSLAVTVSVNEYDRASYYINAGDIYNRRGQPDSALFYVRQGSAIAIKIRHREEMRDAAEQMALSFASLKKYDSAYLYQQLFSRLKDSIQNENSQKAILQREATLRIEQQRRIQQAELKQQRLWRNVIIGIAVFVILVIIMLYSRYRTLQEIKHQQQFNKQQNEMFNLAVSVQEKERKRIAEDIHDSLGSLLSAAKLKLSMLDEEKGQFTAAQLEKYQATLALLDEASAELRNISHNIMPATLSKLGLVAALENLVDKISSHSGLRLQFEVHDFQNRLDETTEISIYRMVLELINNIVKHAGAKKATVQLVKYPDYINVIVEDNGKGFDCKKAKELNKGIGLSNIHSRVDYLSGKIDIDSSPGRGTTIIIDIPYTD